MEWLTKLILEEGVAHSVLLLAIVIALGLLIGKIQFKSISLGIAGVLFSGILVIHFGHYFHMEGLNKEVLEFCREFGLILFVYTIGMQVGPGFMDSMKREGLPLNILAAIIVLSGVVVTILVALFGGVDLPVALGLFSGATTNTPSLGAGGAAAVQAAVDICKSGIDAAQCIPTLQSVGLDQNAIAQLQSLPADQYASSLKTVVKEKVDTLNGQGYAVAYPFGILGIIIAMLLVRWIFKIKLDKEQESFQKARELAAPGLKVLNLCITNQSVTGKSISDVLERHHMHAVVSRVRGSDNIVRIATPDTTLEMGMIVTAVGPEEQLVLLLELLGEKSSEDLRKTSAELKTRDILVTRKDVLGKRIENLGWSEKYDCVVTRVTRGEFRLLAEPAAISLQLGDIIRVVGEEVALNQISQEVGNSEKQLAHPEVLPLFIGIGLGVLFGSIPFFIPGIPAPVKLGLAGGPLLVAIVLARFRRVGPFNFYLPLGANLVLREVGIVLFLACVGIKAGGSFFKVLLEGDGFYWMALGTLITIIPLLIAGFIGRAIFKLNYMSLSGVLSGAMTDPPALAFANTLTKSEAPNVAYASVYPLTMLLRILTAQLMGIFLLI